MDGLDLSISESESRCVSLGVLDVGVAVLMFDDIDQGLFILIFSCECFLWIHVEHSPRHAFIKS